MQLIKHLEPNLRSISLFTIRMLWFVKNILHYQRACGQVISHPFNNGEGRGSTFLSGESLAPRPYCSSVCLWPLLDFLLGHGDELGWIVCECVCVQL